MRHLVLYTISMAGLLYKDGIILMCKNASELMSLVDEMSAAAASMHTGQQNYDTFVRTRDTLQDRVQTIFDREKALCSAIKQLNSLIQ